MAQPSSPACIRKEFVGPQKPCGDGEFALRIIAWEPEGMPVRGSVVYLHPGAFRAGSADGVDSFAAEICARGLRAISIDYRLNGLGAQARPENQSILEQLEPESKARGFEGLGGRLRGGACLCAIEDVIDMLNLAEQSAELGSLGPVVLFGDSAGGIAALSIVTTPAFSAQVAPEIAGVISLSGALPFFGAVDARQGPPVYWLHCEGDRKVSSLSASAFAELAAERAQPTQVHLLPGIAHGWFMFARGLVPFADAQSPFSIFWDYAEARIDDALATAARA